MQHLWKSWTRIPHCLLERVNIPYAWCSPKRRVTGNVGIKSDALGVHTIGPTWMIEVLGTSGWEAPSPTNESGFNSMLSEEEIVPFRMASCFSRGARKCCSISTLEIELVFLYKWLINFHLAHVVQHINVFIDRFIFLDKSCILSFLHVHIMVILSPM